MSRLDYGQLRKLIQQRTELGPEGRTASRPKPVRKSAKTNEPRERLKDHHPEDVASLEKKGRNAAFDLALKSHLAKLSEKEQMEFGNAFHDITDVTILQMVKDFDEEHNKKSFIHKRLEPVGKFLRLLDQFMQGVAIGIQSQPEISSIVVGAVRIVIDLAVRFVTFWNKLSDMLCQFSKWLNILQQLSTTCRDKYNGILQEALANVYGDLLDFCVRSRSIFVGANGHLRKYNNLRVFIRVQWNGFEEHFGGIEARVTKNLHNVHLAAQADSLDDQKEALKKLEGLVKIVTDRNAIDERTNFLEWVSKIHYEEIHDEIIEKTHLGTTEWLIRKELFQEWFNGSGSSTLWCHGKPGIGKSVLAANVIDHISTQYVLSDDIGIAYAYCNFQDTATQDPRNLILSLIKQLSWKRNELSESLRGFFKAYHGDARTPNLATCKAQFWNLAELFKEVYIIIDGLDECQEDARGPTLELILDPSQGRENTKGGKTRDGDSKLTPRVALKTVVISRNEADIAKRFQEHAAFILRIENEDVAPDIAAFVQGETESRIHKGDLRIHSQILKEKVIEKLIAEADGMFLVPKLQLKTICEEKTERDVEQVLGNLPQGLDEYYARMLHRINTQTASLKALAFRCFRFVLYASRPLRIEELRDALAMIKPVANRKELNLYREADILDACGGFFIVERSSSIVRPIHITIWSFLENNFRDMNNERVLNRAKAQEEFAIACILYLQIEFRKDGPCQDPQQLHQTIRSNPFLFYAAQNFDYHISKIPSIHPGIVQSFNKLLAGPERPGDEGPDFDRPERANRAIGAILQIRLLRNPFDPVGIRDGFDRNRYSVTAATMLYVTQLQGVRWLTREARWPIPQAVPSIHSAAAAGRKEILIELLDKAVDVNEEDKYGVQPLYYACRYGHYALALILVSRKANVNHVSSKGHALYIACSKGYSTIVHMLLRNNAEVNLPGGPFGNALVAACNGGRLEIVRLLLSHKSTIERSPMQRFSALHEAILGGQKQIVALLLENGADVNETMKGKAALFVAVESQKEDIVSLLIDKKADINVYHPTDATALHVAIRKSRKGQGETRLAELLLRNGTIVHGTENWTPALHAAVEVGSMDMVQLLLRYNADINEAAKDGATAFSIAGREGLTKIGQVLIGNGANLEEQGSEALTWAAKGGHVGMVRWLLDIGVDVNAGHGLEFAATTVMVEEIQPEGEPRRKTRIEETVELLLDRGSSHGSEALKVAIAFDNKRIVEILRERGFEEDAEEEQLDCDDNYGGKGEN